MARYQRRTPEIRRLWQRVEIDCEWGALRAPSVGLLFQDARATPALLEFFESTRVGRMPGRVLPAGGDVEGESDMAKVVLRPQEEETEASEESE